MSQIACWQPRCEMDRDTVTGIFGLACIFVAYVGYNEYFREEPLPARYTMTLKGDGDNIRIYESYINKLIVFYGRHGMPMDASYAVYRIFDAHVGDPLKISPARSRAYFICSIMPNIGRQIVNDKDKLEATGKLLDSLDKQRKVLEAAGNFESIRQRVNNDIAGYMPIFEKCWRQSNDLGKDIKLPFPVSLN